MLQDDILQLREDIKAGHFTNEASVSKGIVLRLLSALSWPIFDPKVVISEYPLSGRRVDYALCHPPGKPALFIEVKTMGQSGPGERQLFEYAFHKGVPMAILTDGPEWHFYLPAEQGDYEERRVYKLDLVEREIGEIVRRLERYLKYDAVCSGEAVAAARRDYKDVARDRLTKDTLPQAWAKLIEEEDELLLELVADRVESLCGYKPDPDTVASFLKTPVALRGTPVPIPPSPPPPPKSPPPAKPWTPTSPSTQGIGFSLDGQWRSARNAREVLYSVFRKFAERDSTFLERFAALPRHGSKRRYLARSPEVLYPNRPDLARDHSYNFGQGWWVAINLDKKSIEKIIKMACEVAGPRYGTDLKINLWD